MDINQIDKKATKMMAGEMILTHPDPKMLEDLQAHRINNAAPHLTAIKEYNLRCRQLVDSGFVNIDPFRMVSMLMVDDPDKTVYGKKQSHIRPNTEEGGLCSVASDMRTPKYIKYETRDIWDLLFFKTRTGWECSYSDIYNIEINLPEGLRTIIDQMLNKGIFDTISVVHQTYPEEDFIDDFLLFGIVWCKGIYQDKRLSADFYLGHHHTT